MMRITSLRWLLVSGVAGVLAGVNLGACTMSEIPIGTDSVGQSGDDGTGGTVAPGTGGASSGSSGTDPGVGGTSAATGGTNPGSGGTSGGSGGSGGTSPAGCLEQDARAVGTACDAVLGARWTGVGCEILWGCTCEGPDCGFLDQSYELCAASHAHCFDNATCSDERKAMRDLLNASKTCTDTADCQTLMVGCGVTEDDCTGAVYANQSLDDERFAERLSRLSTCTGAFEDGPGCALCERAARQATCIDGLCLGSATCALEASALGFFMGQNNACSSDEDCTMAQVGCEVSQDDCTGAVYLTAGYDRAEFEALRDEYYACKGGGCDLCERVVTAPACIAGFCQRPR
jgi:hypothetical protein